MPRSSGAAEVLHDQLQVGIRLHRVERIGRRPGGCAATGSGTIGPTLTATGARNAAAMSDRRRMRVVATANSVTTPTPIARPATRPDAALNTAVRFATPGWRSPCR